MEKDNRAIGDSTDTAADKYLSLAANKVNETISEYVFSLDIETRLELIERFSQTIKILSNSLRTEIEEYDDDEYDEECDEECDEIDDDYEDEDEDEDEYEDEDEEEDWHCDACRKLCEKGRADMAKQRTEQTVRDDELVRAIKSKQELIEKLKTEISDLESDKSKLLAFFWARSNGLRF